jgi:TonB family protein
MSEERKPCTRCARAIDEWSKICPFCNWDQNVPPPAVEPPKPAAVTAYKPEEEFSLKKTAMYGAIGIVALVLSFVVGMLINRDGAPKNAPDTVEEQLAEEQQTKAAGPIKRADTPLVPTNEPGVVEQPVTSAPVAAPAGTATNDYQRTDATAVSSTEYAEIARRAKAEKDKMAVMIDPRSLTGPAYAQAPRPVRRTPPVRPRPQQPIGQQPPPMSGDAVPPPQNTQPANDDAPPARRTATVRTRPVPQYQPLPSLSVRGSARLSLLIGADGRVKQVDIERALPRNTATLVESIQQWRFKPATENGEPVSAPYTVDISFK